MEENVAALAQLFRETAMAHHEAYSATDGDDPDCAGQHVAGPQLGLPFRPSAPSEHPGTNAVVTGGSLVWMTRASWSP